MDAAGGGRTWAHQWDFGFDHGPLAFRRCHPRRRRPEKPVQPPDFTAGWDIHSFGMRERRHCAFVWIRYLHKSSAASDWSHVNVLRLESLSYFQGLLSRIASAALLQPLSRVGFPRHDGQAEAVATSAFHPTLPPELGNQQV